MHVCVRNFRHRDPDATRPHFRHAVITTRRVRVSLPTRHRRISTAQPCSKFELYLKIIDLPSERIHAHICHAVAGTSSFYAEPFLHSLCGQAREQCEKGPACVESF